MIDRNWDVVDLDPLTWRNLGRFIEPGQYIRVAQPGEHGLFVLHDDGHILRVVDTNVGIRHDLGITDASDPQTLAAELHARNEWQRIHVINKQHLALVARQAQSIEHREMTLDQYYRLVGDLLWSSQTGYVSIPPYPGHWNGWTYDVITQFIGYLPETTSVALGVFDDETVAIGLIAALNDGRITRVTTFEALDLQAQPTLSSDFLYELGHALEQDFASPSAMLICSQSVFEEWIEATAKTAVIERAVTEKQAFLKLP
ncbi:MAG: hypothetical protein AAGF95_29070 [Chloroflexota bacterium]